MSKAGGLISGLDHGLEGWPPIVGGGVARLDILRRRLPSLALAVGFKLTALIGDRQIVDGLSSGRDPKIEGGAALEACCRGNKFAAHALLLSEARTQHLVEHLAKPRLHRQKLGRGDREIIGPGVGDADGRLYANSPGGRSPAPARHGL